MCCAFLDSIPMISQDKVTTPVEFTKWARKRNYKTFLIQFKLDGISVELQYENGIFQHAVTRGDGTIGDDVSANVIKIKVFISKLKENFTGEIRVLFISEAKQRSLLSLHYFHGHPRPQVAP